MSFRNSSAFRVHTLDSNSLLVGKVGVEKATQLLSQSPLTSGNTLPSASGMNNHWRLSLRSSCHKGNSAGRLGSCIAIEVTVGTIHIRTVFLLRWVRLFPAVSAAKNECYRKKKTPSSFANNRTLNHPFGVLVIFQCLDLEKHFSLCPSPKPWPGEAGWEPCFSLSDSHPCFSWNKGIACLQPLGRAPVPREREGCISIFPQQHTVKSRRSCKL